MGLSHAGQRRVGVARSPRPGHRPFPCRERGCGAGPSRWEGGGTAGGARKAPGRPAARRGQRLLPRGGQAGGRREKRSAGRAAGPLRRQRQRVRARREPGFPRRRSHLPSPRWRGGEAGVRRCAAGRAPGSAGPRPGRRGRPGSPVSGRASVARASLPASSPPPGAPAGRRGRGTRCPRRAACGPRGTAVGAVGDAGSVCSFSGTVARLASGLPLHTLKTSEAFLAYVFQSHEEDDRKVRRREKNRVAAQRSRKKQTQKADKLHEVSGYLTFCRHSLGTGHGTSQ